MAPIHPASSCGHLEKAGLWLTVNGWAKQKGDMSHLIWSVVETVASLTHFFRLEPGDVIFTDTPEVVGAASHQVLPPSSVNKISRQAEVLADLPFSTTSTEWEATA